LSDILTKASAKRSASRSNATDFVALDVPGPRITVEEITDRNVERESDQMQPTGADAVLADLVF
jgi:hypothetical protein